MNPPRRRLRFQFACSLLAAFATILGQGCEQSKRRAIPAPLKDPVKQSCTGRITKVWGGDNFEFSTGKETHYMLLLGVDSPDPGQPFYMQSRKETEKIARKKVVTAHTFARDEVMREIVELIVPVGKTKGDFDGDEFNLGVELIKRGWARYNGTPFDGAEELVAAEASAKEQKIGIWAEPNKPKATPKKQEKKKTKDAN